MRWNLICVWNSQILKKCGVKKSRTDSPTQHQVIMEFPWQEWEPLHLKEPGPIHIPGIQERANCLISKFKDKSGKPPKVNTCMDVAWEYRFFAWFWFAFCEILAPWCRCWEWFHLVVWVLIAYPACSWYLCAQSNILFQPSFLFSLEPKRKPSHFFLEQWYLSRGLTESAGSPLSSPESSRKVRIWCRELLTHNLMPCWDENRLYSQA